MGKHFEQWSILWINLLSHTCSVFLVRKLAYIQNHVDTLSGGLQKMAETRADVARLQDQLATKTVKLESAAAAAQSLLQQMSVSTGQAEADRQRVAAIVEGVTAKVGRREADWRTGDGACLGGERWHNVCLDSNYSSRTSPPSKQIISNNLHGRPRKLRRSRTTRKRSWRRRSPRCRPLLRRSTPSRPPTSRP